jgi:hypothetical protein
MLTFLPEEYKGRILRQYRLRLASIYLLLASGVLLVGCALFVPSYAFLDSKRDAALLEKSALSSAGADATALEAEVAAIKEKIRVIEDVSAEPSVASILEHVLDKRSTGISITALSLRRTPGGAGSAIVVSGTASTRDLLVAFSKSLQGDLSFTKIDLPVSSLAKSKDIPFSIAITSKI